MMSIMALPPEDQSPGDVFERSDRDSALSKIGEQTLTNPSYVGYLWWVMLADPEDEDFRQRFYSLSLGGKASWDYDEAHEGMNGLSPVVPATVMSDDSAYMKFIGDPKAHVRVANLAMGEALIVSLTRCDDGQWRVSRVGGEPDYPVKLSGA